MKPFLLALLVFLGVFSFSIAFSATTFGDHLVWTHSASIDYHAANEFISVHYGAKSSSPYFGRNAPDPIYDARRGFIDDDAEILRHPSLSLCGFDLVNTSVSVSDYSDLNKVRESYLPELEKLTRYSIYPNEAIEHIVFWNPVLREEHQVHTRPSNQIDTPTSHFVSTAHIDKDFGAYGSVEELVELFVNNHMHGKEYQFPVAKVSKALQRGQRFSIVNYWKNIGTLPIQRAPLALLSTHYDDPLKAFPDVSPDPKRSRWYTYPEMTPKEVLCFCQYDRDVEKPSDMWHCALMDVGDQSIPRSSFDVRGLVVFQEVVPDHRDRFRPDRTRVLLSESESADFCSEQTKRWKERNNASPKS